jgi:hypothetical protein
MKEDNMTEIEKMDYENRTGYDYPMYKNTVETIYALDKQK